MNRLQVLMMLYGLFDIAMGLVGTMNAPNHEPWSLVGGGVAGILVIGFAALSKTSPRAGYIGATVVALLVAGRFAPKAIGGVVYPAGIICGVSILFALVLVGSHFAAMNKRKQTSIDPKA